MTTSLAQFELPLAFVAGCLFATLIFYATLKNSEAQLQFQLAFKQLALFLTLGMAGFFISVSALQWSKGTNQENKKTYAAVTQPTPVITDESPLLVQSSGSVTTSQLTKIQWLIPAQVVQESDIASTSIQQLRAIAQGIDANANVKNVEILMWEKSSLQKNTSAFLMRDVQQKLQKQNYVYRQTNEQSGQGQGATVREFVAINTRQKKIVPGFWMITPEFTLLCWGDFKDGQ